MREGKSNGEFFFYLHVMPVDSSPPMKRIYETNVNDEQVNRAPLVTQKFLTFKFFQPNHKR